jgi:hypothetical protein
VRSSRWCRSVREKVDNRPPASSMASGIPSRQRTASAIRRRSVGVGGGPGRPGRGRPLPREPPTGPGWGRVAGAATAGRRTRRPGAVGAVPRTTAIARNAAEPRPAGDSRTQHRPAWVRSR